MPARKSFISVAANNDGVIRVASLPEGMAEVPATYAVRRATGFAPLKSRKTGSRSVARIDNATITFDPGARALTARSLSVSWIGPEGPRTWKPGMIDRENLGGSPLSLDLVDENLVGSAHQDYDPMKGLGGHDASPYLLLDTIKGEVLAGKERTIDDGPSFAEYQRLTRGEKPQVLRRWSDNALDILRRVRQVPPGLLSRSGMTILRDDSLPWDPRRGWVKPRPDREPQILYFVPSFDGYKAALGRLVRLLGQIPRVPDWTLGTWFSCYREMGEKDYRKLKADFDRHGLPLDAVVVDTDWHKYFWHGFDWNKKLFPNPTRFRDWLRKNGLHGVFNVHPAYIPEKDSRLPGFLERTGAERRILDERTAPNRFHKDTQPIDLFDRTQAEAYFDIFHRPIEEGGGCDMWWVDGALRDNKGRDASAWMNELYTHYGRTPSKKSNVAPLVLSRTHGLGAHRSTLHFTGDTFSQWKVLEHEVRLTPLAANSLLGFVSHDIGGFFRNNPRDKKNKPTDELMVRWAQFGALSPIMRFHSDHGVREPWNFSARALGIIRNFLQLRRGLFPYLRALADEAHETGVGMCRPMYYEFPDHEESHEFAGTQYMLGESLLVAPVTNAEGIVYTWLPPGRWHHLFTERAVLGPCVIVEKVPLEYVPVYRAGDAGAVTTG